MKSRKGPRGQGKVEAIIAAALLLATIVLFCLCYQPTRSSEKKPLRKCPPVQEDEREAPSQVRPEARVTVPAGI